MAPAERPVHEGSRGYEEEHARLERELDRARERSGCRTRRGAGSVLEDIIRGRTGTDRRGGDGGVLDRLPRRPRDLPRRSRDGLTDAATVLDILLGRPRGG
ncbi:MAG: hypothetical protein GWM90_09010 [Gemmatimonadetes bacterium]|nr:hypothetical protein [Gemmatimonadota bacterium]NIQ54037.1 hypothetical protein [Gemmatimonadota bacterium]NIU74221.1 hypothetical protein [Gammaproteobacteria bacterium]NIX44249.1 hypothetical protein [Gemmatimonadota bacterium]